MKWGLFQASQLGWLALAPLIIFFYLMKLTRRERLVSALFLWQRATSQARVDSFWQKLRQNLLLWLQLLLLLLMALALARPYHIQPGHLPKQVALVLDQSASMAARSDGGRTRFARAQQQARELVRQAPAGTEFLLAALGKSPRILLPFSSDRDRLEQAIGAMTWEAVELDRATVAPLVLSLTRSNPKCEVLIFGDQPFSGLPARFISCGGGGRNLAVTSFQVEGERAFVRVRSFSPQAEVVALRILDRQGATIVSRTIPLAARGERTLNLDLPQVEGALQLRLDVDDDLEVDDSAWALPSGKRRLRVALKGPISPFMQQALLAQEGVTLVPQGASAQEVACSVWDRPPAQLTPGAHIVECGEPAPAKAPEESLSPEAQGPLALLPLGELWAVGVRPPSYQSWAGEALQPMAWLVTADSRPALLQLKGRQHNILAFAFRLEESNLPLHPALPLVLARFLESAQGSLLSDAPRQLRCGQEVVWQSTGRLRLTGPRSQSALLEPNGGKAAFTPTRPGVYTVSSADGSGEPVTLVANFYSEAESDLLGANEPTTTPSPTPTAAEPPPPEAPRTSEPFAAEYWRWAVGGVLLLSLAEWWLYWRPRPARAQRPRLGQGPA